jgi:hypothetical protein
MGPMEPISNNTGASHSPHEPSNRGQSKHQVVQKKSCLGVLMRIFRRVIDYVCGLFGVVEVLYYEAQDGLAEKKAIYNGDYNIDIGRDPCSPKDVFENPPKFSTDWVDNFVAKTDHLDDMPPAGKAPTTRDPTDWDRKHVHYCIEAYQSSQDVGIACGIRLSTWAARDLPWKQSGNRYGTAPHPEKDLGYSFELAPVSCPKCMEWMDKQLKKCADCGKMLTARLLAERKYCPDCMIKHR